MSRRVPAQRRNPPLPARRLQIGFVRDDAERFIEEVCGYEPEIAAKLRIEERELEAGKRN